MPNEADQTADHLLRVSEVAQLVGIKRPTIYKRLAAGDFPVPLRISPGAVRWPKSEVVAWIKSRPRATGDGIRRADLDAGVTAGAADWHCWQPARR